MISLQGLSHDTPLALYEALRQAYVPAPAARRAAEALEADMTQHLATKQDLAKMTFLLAATMGLQAMPR